MSIIRKWPLLRLKETNEKYLKRVAVVDGRWKKGKEIKETMKEGKQVLMDQASEMKNGVMEGKKERKGKRKKE